MRKLERYLCSVIMLLNWLGGWRWSWMSDDSAANGWSWISDDAMPVEHGSNLRGELVGKATSLESCPQTHLQFTPPSHCVLLEALLPQPGRYSMLAPEATIEWQAVWKVTLSGFKQKDWDGDYVQYPGKVFEMFGRPTYWSWDCAIFLYFHEPSGSWTLAPASMWAEWKIGLYQDQFFAHESYKAKIRNGWCEVVQDGTSATFRKPTGSLVLNKHVSMKRSGKEEVKVELKMQSLLSSIPGGLDTLRLSGADPKRWSLLLLICQVLNELPADDGYLSLNLPKSTNALDVAFRRQCSEIQNAAVRRKKEDARRLWIQRRLDERSRLMAAELIAEEETEKKNKLSKGPQSKKKPKATKKNRQQASTSSVAEASANLQELQDSQEDVDQLEGSSDPSGFALHEDVSDAIIQLRHNFPMFDDDVLCDHFMEADYDLEKAVMSLSKLEAEPVAILEPVQNIPLHPQPRVRKEAPKRLMANVVARTDHAHLPLYCFIAVVAKSEQSQKYRPGQLVRPIPEDRFRLLGDEKGHFWLKKTKVPQVGDIVEVCFYEEDTHDYLRMAHGKYPHQNEDLLCTTLTLHTPCDLEKNDPCLKCA